MSRTNGMRRVVVTGMGAVSALGNDVASTWEGLLAGRSGVRRIESFDPSRVDSQIAAEVRDFDPSAVIDRKEMRRMDRYIQFGLVVAREALDQADLPGRIDGRLAERTGVILGSGLGGVATLFDNVLLMGERGPDRISPFFIPMGIANVGSGQIAIAFGMLGPNFATVSACATGAHAIGEAWETIRRDDADVMLAGGTEAGITKVGIGGFGAMRALSRRNDDPEAASRPFDAERDGFVMGEAGGIVVLEELEHAKKRDAKIYAELGGYGISSDAQHITEPDPTGQHPARAMRMAMDDSGVGPENIDYINAHGTSTPLGDASETRVIKVALGEEKARKTPISSTKGATGHCLGASGAIEAITSIFAVQRDVIPPTINYEYPDPECDLDYIPNESRDWTTDVALSNNFGFGGHNACLVVKKFQG
jgi:3-oxoacyl-[acyl-carrier-protein] synthase II